MDSLALAIWLTVNHVVCLHYVGSVCLICSQHFFIVRLSTAQRISGTILLFVVVIAYTFQHKNFESSVDDTIHERIYVSYFICLRLFSFGFPQYEIQSVAWLDQLSLLQYCSHSTFRDTRCITRHFYDAYICILSVSFISYI